MHRLRSSRADAHALGVGARGARREEDARGGGAVGALEQLDARQLGRRERSSAELTRRWPQRAASPPRCRRPVAVDGRSRRRGTAAQSARASVPGARRERVADALSVARGRPAVAAGRARFGGVGRRIGGRGARRALRGARRTRPRPSREDRRAGGRQLRERAQTRPPLRAFASRCRRLRHPAPRHAHAPGTVPEDAQPGRGLRVAPALVLAAAMATMEVPARVTAGFGPEPVAGRWRWRRWRR